MLKENINIILLECEIHRNNKKKIIILILYLPKSSNTAYFINMY